MKVMERNKQSFHYALYEDRKPLLDDVGNKTGEYAPAYGEAVPMRASVSPAAGFAMQEVFGTSEQYDKVILTDDLDCPITETTVLFLDKPPDYGPNGSPVYDYVVRRVAKSLNFIAYGVSKVEVT